MTHLLLGVGPTSKNPLTSYLASIKHLAIFEIIYRLVYWNNNNYVPLLVAIYIYFAGTKVDATTLLNCLGLSVLYNVFLRKLRGTTTSSASFIKDQASNCKLVGIWDNFEYQKNIVREKIKPCLVRRIISPTQDVILLVFTNL